MHAGNEALEVGTCLECGLEAGCAAWPSEALFSAERPHLPWSSGLSVMSAKAVCRSTISAGMRSGWQTHRRNNRLPECAHCERKHEGGRKGNTKRCLAVAQELKQSAASAAINVVLKNFEILESLWRKETAGASCHSCIHTSTHLSVQHKRRSVLKGVVIKKARLAHQRFVNQQTLEI